MTAQPMPSVAYGHFLPMPVYFDDLDSMGLLHNARYAVLLERAIIAFWSAQESTEDDDNGGDANLLSRPDAFVAVAEFSITYRSPVRNVGTVGIHFWVEHLGNTSAVYGFRIISLDGETVHAEGRRVNINLGPTTMRPVPWGPETRAIFETLIK